MRIFVLTAFLLLWPIEPGQMLLPGSQAPSFEPESWIGSGRPAKGKILIIDCWATWCGPCLDQHPHLSDLSEKFKDSVSVVGLNIWDFKPGEKTKANRSRFARIAKFVQDHAKDLRYPVALDSDRETMTKAWMDAASRKTIPTCFVVDSFGKIAWIGHPENVEAVLEQLLAGKWDIDKAAIQYREVVAERKAAAERDARIAEAILLAAKNGDLLAFEAATKDLGYGASTNIRRGLEMIANDVPDFCALYLDRAMWDDKRFDSITVCKLGMLIVKSKKDSKITSRGLNICRKAMERPDSDQELVCYAHCYFAQALHEVHKSRDAMAELDKARERAKSLEPSSRRAVLDYIEETQRDWR